MIAPPLYKSEMEALSYESSCVNVELGDVAGGGAMAGGGGGTFCVLGRFYNLPERTSMPPSPLSLLSSSLLPSLPPSLLPLPFAHCDTHTHTHTHTHKHTEKDEMDYDVMSRLWCTYRKGFRAISECSIFYW